MIRKSCSWNTSASDCNNKYSESCIWDAALKKCNKKGDSGAAHAASRSSVGPSSPSPPLIGAPFGSREGSPPSPPTGSPTEREETITGPFDPGRRAREEPRSEGSTSQPSSPRSPLARDSAAAHAGASSSVSPWPVAPSTVLTRGPPASWAGSPPADGLTGGLTGLGRLRELMSRLLPTSRRPNSAVARPHGLGEVQLSRLTTRARSATHKSPRPPSGVPTGPKPEDAPLDPSSPSRPQGPEPNSGQPSREASGPTITPHTSIASSTQPLQDAIVQRSFLPGVSGGPSPGGRSSPRPAASGDASSSDDLPSLSAGAGMPSPLRLPEEDTAAVFKRLNLPPRAFPGLLPHTSIASSTQPLQDAIVQRSFLPSASGGPPPGGRSSPRPAASGDASSRVPEEDGTAALAERLERLRLPLRLPALFAQSSTENPVPSLFLGPQPSIVPNEPARSHTPSSPRVLKPDSFTEKEEMQGGSSSSASRRQSASPGRSSNEGGVPRPASPSPASASSQPAGGSPSAGNHTSSSQPLRDIAVKGRSTLVYDGSPSAHSMVSEWAPTDRAASLPAASSRKPRHILPGSPGRVSPPSRSVPESPRLASPSPASPSRPLQAPLSVPPSVAPPLDLFTQSPTPEYAQPSRAASGSRDIIPHTPEDDKRARPSIFGSPRGSVGSTSSSSRSSSNPRSDQSLPASSPNSSHQQTINLISGGESTFPGTSATSSGSTGEVEGNSPFTRPGSPASSPNSSHQQTKALGGNLSMVQASRSLRTPSLPSSSSGSIPVKKKLSRSQRAQARREILLLLRDTPKRRELLQLWDTPKGRELFNWIKSIATSSIRNKRQRDEFIREQIKTYTAANPQNLQSSAARALALPPPGPMAEEVDITRDDSPTDSEEVFHPHAERYDISKADSP
jgi:hypothetical protein